MAIQLQTDPSSIASGLLDATPQRICAGVISARPRLDGIDFVRGLVMIIMVLDHARDYLSAGGLNPRDVNDTALFLTRWITHYCAPIFIFLAGVSAFLYGNRDRSPGEVARFLFTRGMWLILIELTLVRFAWTFNVAYTFVFFQVIWVIGCSMVALAGFVYLPRRVIIAISVALILGHNLLDSVDMASFGSLAWLWMFVHSPGELRPTTDTQVLVLYPLIPWIAVMAAGYALGPVFLLREPQRRRTLLSLGLAITIGFVALRATNLYGDPEPWSLQGDSMATLLSFINCEKYPPSLLYLAMTLGTGLIVLALFRSATTPLSRAIVTIGRVPFLFYVAHIFVVHLMAVVVAWLLGIDMAWLFEDMPLLAKPDGFGLSLAGVYAMWLLAVLMLYPMCRWFGEVKQRRKDWWLSYL